jgi:predicted nucleic acid-binding protein
MNVVSNASPLINLTRIGQLTLLPRIFGRLLIPDAVWQEVVIDGRGQPGAEEVRLADWIERKSVMNSFTTPGT